MKMALQTHHQKSMRSEWFLQKQGLAPARGFAVASLPVGRKGAHESRIDSLIWEERSEVGE